MKKNMVKRWKDLALCIEPIFSYPVMSQVEINGPLVISCPLSSVTFKQYAHVSLKLQGAGHHFLAEVTRKHIVGSCPYFRNGMKYVDAQFQLE